MPKLRLLSLVVAASLAPAGAAAFCGFYVSKADTALFNEASKVVIARDGERTVITMANDYRGELEEFAIVIPVPTKLERSQIHVAENALIEHVDAYTAPRLVEYYDEDPCNERLAALAYLDAAPRARSATAQKSADAHGVAIEASYTVGEYDILILSAEQSEGLERWLLENDYKVPAGAASVLGSYIKQGMRFFVAKVNLAAQSKLGYTYLRPIQVAFESPKFMLPIRLGMLNANGPQELFVFTLTPKGRVETSNYRTVSIPSGDELPVYVREEFGDFYSAMFDEQVRRNGMRTVFLEYAWDTGWCDPCAADPLSAEELRTLGVSWLQDDAPAFPPGARPSPPRLRVPPRRPANVYITRMHVRYDGENFPEDLFFQETGNRENFQGRYVLRHPWTGERNQCDAARDYFEKLPARRSREAATLASLTGWEIGAIRERMGLSEAEPVAKRWWEKLWPEP